MPTSDAPLACSGPLIVVMNRKAGHEDGDASRAEICDALKHGGREYRWVDADPRRMGHAIDESAALARRLEGALVAVGGDGTVATAAAAALAAGVPLGVIPHGTFNYFARAQGIPTEPAEAARALLGARVQPVQAGSVNGELFLVNASLGFYPQLLEDREAFLQRAGRNQLLAILSSLVLALRGWTQLRIEAERDSPMRRTPTLFVGNNHVQLERLGFEPELLAQLGKGRLIGLNPQPISTWQMLGLILRGALGRLGEDEHLDRFSFSRMRVKPPGRRRVKVALDGEVRMMRTPIVIETLPQRLHLLVPDEGVTTG